MPVYGKLMSTWPVAGGVIYEEGVVYAAAGITHYDGTYVVALNPATGESIWRNDVSGTLSTQVNCGISLQGELLVRGDELHFLGGGPYQFARYDRRTGKCLNEPHNDVTSRFQTAFYAHFPQYGKYESLHHTFPDGRTLMYSPSYDGSQPSPLELLEPAVTNQSAPGRKGETNSGERREQDRTPVWKSKDTPLYTAFIITPQVLVAAGPGPGEGQKPILTAMRLSDGTPLWTTELPAVPVKGGLAIDQHKRMVVTLEDGQVLCFAADNE